MNVFAHSLLAASLAAAAALAQTAISAEIAAPGQVAILSAHATGTQTYECRADPGGALTWTFLEPTANLTVNGQTIGKHYAGPTWQLNDGSAVVGKVVAKAQGETTADIAWLKLDAARHTGAGKFDNVSAIQRINTRGGMLSGPCTVQGERMAVPYEADYVFLSD